MLSRRLFFWNVERILSTNLIPYASRVGAVQWLGFITAVCSFPLFWLVVNVILEKSLAQALQQQLPILFQQAAVNSFDAHALVLKSEASLKTLIEGISFNYGWLGAVVKHVNVLEISLTLTNEAVDADVHFIFDQRQYGVHWSLEVVWEHTKLLALILLNPVLVTLLVLLLWRRHKGERSHTRSPLQKGNDVVLISSLEQPQTLAIEAPQALNIGDQAPNLAMNPSYELQFEPTTQSVVIDGRRIVMPKTPFFYYLWYAQRQLNGLPPFVNPSMHHPDIRAGEELAQLMREFGGHARAINDLELQGLRAKTLDQNRNKIKDKLLNQLGNCAEDFLFMKTRDQKTGRYQYQLKSSKLVIVNS